MALLRGVCINDLSILKIESLHFRMLKSIIPGEVIMIAASMNVSILTIDRLIKKRMLRFLAHVQRKSNDSLQKIVIHSRIGNGQSAKVLLQ